MRQTLSIGNDNLSRPGVNKTELHWKPEAADEGVNVVCIEATDNYTYVNLCQLRYSCYLYDNILNYTFIQ